MSRGQRDQRSLWGAYSPHYIITDSPKGRQHLSAAIRLMAWLGRKGIEFQIRRSLSHPTGPNFWLVVNPNGEL